MSNVELSVTQDVFDRLWDMAGTTRRKQVRVETRELELLLIDYGRMLNGLRAAGVKVNEPSRRERPRLTQ